MTVLKQKPVPEITPWISYAGSCISTRKKASSQPEIQPPGPRAQEPGPESSQGRGLYSTSPKSASNSGSHGIYQLSSNMGTMGEFLEFLEDREPEIAARLKEAGPMNTRGRTGIMPEEWQEIDRENPERFAELAARVYSPQFLPACNQGRGIQDRTGYKAGITGLKRGPVEYRCAARCARVHEHLPESGG